MIGRPVLITLGAVARRAPRLAYTAAHWLSKFSRGNLTREHYASLFPHLSNDDIDAAIRDSWSNQLRSAVLKESVQRYGAAGLRRYIVPNPALAQLRAPVILASFHLGPMRALLAALEMLETETVIIRAELFPYNPTKVTMVQAGESEATRARAVHTAVKALQERKFVLLTVEPDSGTQIEVSLFGRPFVFGRGAFALARVARAPILPLVTRWRGSHVEIVTGEAIEASSDESEMAGAVARWLQRYLTENPGELKSRLMKLFR